jgi:predicted small secreted protein
MLISGVGPSIPNVMSSPTVRDRVRFRNTVRPRVDGFDRSVIRASNRESGKNEWLRYDGDIRTRSTCLCWKIGRRRLKNLPAWQEKASVSLCFLTAIVVFGCSVLASCPSVTGRGRDVAKSAPESSCLVYVLLHRFCVGICWSRHVYGLARGGGGQRPVMT